MNKWTKFFMLGGVIFGIVLGATYDAGRRHAIRETHDAMSKWQEAIYARALAARERAFVAETEMLLHEIEELKAKKCEVRK